MKISKLKAILTGVNEFLSIHYTFNCPVWYKKSAHGAGEHFCVLWKLAQVRPYTFMGVC